MPEGPELFLSSLYINRLCSDKIFTGEVVKNPIHKCQDIIWNKSSYTISSASQGKELMLYLQDCSCGSKKSSNENESCSVLFTFGMSGKFEFVSANSLPKHSHLIFFTKSEPQMALVFVDYRRFGKWIRGGNWSDERGPCVIQEPGRFVDNVAANLNNCAFNKPICEVMLNQKFFNGIGNYLRAEILFRCKIAPFEKARTVLQLNELKQEPKAELIEGSQPGADDKRMNGKNVRKSELKTLGKKTSKLPSVIDSKGIKMEFEESETDGSCLNHFTLKAQELLKLCTSVPLEVINIGSTKYSLSELYKDNSEGKSFNDWLQCYYQDGMKNMVDHNKRTIWFCGPAGPMAPKEQKVRGKKKRKTSSKDDMNTDGDQEDSKKPEAHEKHPKATLTRTKLKDIQRETRKVTVKEKEARADKKEHPKAQKRKRNMETNFDDHGEKIKAKKTQPIKSISAPKRLTRSSLKIEQ